eukprot:Clim_evm52s55 gene=Clim_evmTU52s55
MVMNTEEVNSFRNLFNAVKGDDVKAAVEDLLLLPTQDLVDIVQDPILAAKASSPSEFDSSIGKAYKKITPGQLWREGSDRGTEKQSGDRQTLIASAIPSYEAAPLIIIFPGVVAEFVDTCPFSSIVKGPARANSRFAIEFKEKLAAKGNVTDLLFNLDKCAEDEVPLESILDVASLDEGDLTIVKLVHLRPVLGSLESLGDMGTLCKRLLRRLNIIFDVLSLSSDHPVHFLGYSRGVNTAFEVLAKSRADAGKYPWSTQVKSIVSLGGPLYGAEAADVAFNNEDEFSYRVIEALREIVAQWKKSAEKYDTGSKRSALMGLMKSGGSAVVEMGKLTTIRIPEERGFNYEEWSVSVPRASPLLTMLSEFMVKQFNFANPLKEYGENVDRLEVFVNAVIAGADSLTTESRLDFWKQHTVPTDVQYLGLAATMGEPTYSPGNVHQMNTNVGIYRSESVDFVTLRNLYYQLLRTSGQECNDSQIGMARSCFINHALHKALNPAQEPFNAKTIAILNQHHWGMALDAAIQDRSGTSPFPRKSLLTAIAVYLAQQSRSK